MSSQLAPSDLILKELHDSVTTDAQTKAKKAQVVSLVVSPIALQLEGALQPSWSSGEE